MKRTPKLSFESAKEKGVKKKNLKNVTIHQLKKEKNREKFTPQGTENYELVFVMGDDSQWHLAYKANITPENIMDNMNAYFSCETGDIVFVQPMVFKSNVTGTAATRYSGTRNITTDSYNGQYRLREVSRGGSNTAIQTFNFNTSGTFTLNNVPANATVSSVTVSPSLSYIRSGNTITVNSNSGSGEGWLLVNLNLNSETVPSDTVRFIYGEYVPNAQLYRSVSCTYPWQENCVLYSWCNGGDNKFRLHQQDINYRPLLSGLTYQARIVRRSDHTVVWTASSSFQGIDEVSVPYIGVLGVLYDLELRLITYNPNSSWQTVGEFFSQTCSSNTGPGDELGWEEKCL
ncbi:MAG: hypothetical protein LBU57_08670 [Dysgonamonadaceae bacterium]|jgi:hypothetical protein|nr:hypothetical protein [Dysgonamonadaceae bacterium]